MQRISVSLSDDEYDELERLAEENARSISAEARLRIRQSLTAPKASDPRVITDADPLQVERAVRSVSVPRAGDLAGPAKPVWKPGTKP